ncbi:MAG: hypothetical protein K8R87_00410 [Verrucomicrobia bacterium]|nr:hypothetical protein [Verrucomicrobiota bacterium]
MKISTFIANLAVAPVLLALIAAGSVLGQSDSRIELQELKATLQVSAGQIQELEQKLGKAKEQVKSLSESLANANLDGQQAREGYEKLRIQMEGLGVAALDPTNTELQQRLLTALSDLRILEGHRRILTEALVGLSEASLAHAKNNSGGDAASRENLNKSLAAAERALSGSKLNVASGAAESGTLDNARIISLKEDMGVAILNIGSRQGVHPGMPFSIYRKDKPVARALVVDVRQGISGAVVQELISKDESVKVGDTGRAETSKG